MKNKYSQFNFEEKLQIEALLKARKK